MSIERIKCKDCVAECMAEGGWCEGLRVEETEGLGPRKTSSWKKSIGVHQQVAHNMYLTGALWVCSMKHELDADPADVMRAAGMVAMI